MRSALERAQASPNRPGTLSRKKPGRFTGGFLPPFLPAPPLFATYEDLTANAPAAAEILYEEFGSRTFDEWNERLSAFKGQWAPVQDTLGLRQDVQVEANGYILETHTKEGAPFKLVTSPVPVQ